MAKFAVLFFAALAFQAAFAGVRRNHRHHESYESDQIVGYQTGKFDEYVGQIQTVTSELSGCLQNVLPNNKLVVKTLIWQNRELAQVVGLIINRLQAETNVYSGNVDKTIQKVLGELREIEASLQQTVGFTDVSNVSQLKNQLNTNVQGVAELIEKLVYLVQADLPETQGSLYATIRGILGDYLSAVQTIQSQVQYISQDVQGLQGPKQLGTQIRELTGSLAGHIQDAYLNTKQVRWALREYSQNIETIVGKLQGEVTVGNKDIDVVLLQLTNKLRQLLLPLEQIISSDAIINVTDLRGRLVGCLENVAAVVEQLVQVAQTGSQKVQADSLIQQVIHDYWYALKQVCLQIQGGYQGGIYDQTGGLYGKSTYGLYQKLGWNGGKYGLGLYGQGGLSGQKGLYKSGEVGYPWGLLGKSGYKSQSGKGLAIQVQAVASDLNAALQNVYVDNTLVRQTLINLIREYAQNIEIIVERLEQISYTTGISSVTPQQVAQELRQIVVPLRQIINSGLTVNAKELINKLGLCVQNIVNVLEKLTYGTQGAQDLELVKTASYDVVRGVLVQFLTATRNLCIQVENISRVTQRGQTTSGFGIQIQTLANGLTAALQTITVDNVQVRQILVEQCRELAQYLETIIERLQTVNGAGLPQQIATNLRQIVLALRQVGEYQDIASVQKLRWILITCIQDAATDIQKLLWVQQSSPLKGGQGLLDTGLHGIVNDFVALLQNQQIQLQNIYQHGQYGQGVQQLAVQIQAITNNLAVFLQNVPSNGEQVRQQLEIQARKLARNIEVIIQRLEVETGYTQEISVIQKVILNLRNIVSTLEQVTVYETSNSVYELCLHFNVVLQNVASELRKLAYVAQFDTQYTQGNLNGVVRSVLIQYLNVIQYVQIQLQGINQTVQIGQTPRELALQIEVVARRLTGLLRVDVPDNRQTQSTLIYQARRLCQIIDIIASKLQVQIGTGKGTTYSVLQQVAGNLKQIQVYLQQTITTVNVASTYQLKIQLINLIRDAAIEIQKLIYVAQPDIHQSQGSAYALVRSVLIDFLGGLQNLQVQIQDNLQIVLSGQSPRALVLQIQSVAQRLNGYLQYVQPNSVQLRQTLVIQIGELAQTIENVVQLLQAEIKNSGENSAVLKQTVAELNKISLSLQKIAVLGTEVSVADLCNQLNLDVQHIVAVIQRLAYIADYQLEKVQVDTYNNGVLNGVFNNVLSTLRNILIQLQNTRQIGQYGLNTQELANQIQTVTNHLSQSLQLVGASTKQVKQALAIQALRYALCIQNIVDKLETEASYNSLINVGTLKEIVQNLRQVVVALQQIGGSLTTTTTTDLRTQLNTQIQKAAAQIQKLLVAQTGLQQTQGPIGTILKSVLIDYLAAVQNLYIRIQNIAQISQKGQNLYQLAIQIETTISDLSTYFRYVLPTNQLVGQSIIVETRQLAEVISNIVNKLQAISGGEVNGLVQQVVGQLKQVELSLQQIVGGQIVGDIYQQRIQLQVNVRRAAIVIQELVWAIQPELEQVQVGTGIATLVREVLNEFLVAVQNVYIQVYNAVPITQIRKNWGLELAGQDVYQGQWGRGQGLGLYRPYLGGQGLVGGVGVLRGQIAQSPRQCLIQIKNVVNKLCNILQGSTLNNQLNTQQAKQIIAVQIRQLTQIIETIIDELQGQISLNGISGLQQVIIRLREVQQSLRQIVGYNTFTSVYQLKAELENCIQIAVAQIEKLVFIVEQVPQGKLYLVIEGVLNDFLNGIEHILLQIRNVVQGGWYGQGLYGSGSGIGDLYNQYGKGWGSTDRLGLYSNAGQLGQYGKGFGLGWYGKGYGNGLQGDWKCESCRQLVSQIQILANRVAEELQTVGTRNVQIKQVLIVQTRQLIQVIENIIDRLETELRSQYGATGAQQIIRVLRQIQDQLQQIVSSGVLTTVYQIKGQYAECIQTIAVELNKLTLLVQSDVQIQSIVRNVLVQYLVYLRSLQYQLQGNTLGLRSPYELSSKLYDVAGDLTGTLRTYPYGRGGIQIGDYAQNIDRLESQGWDNSDVYIHPRQVWGKLGQIHDYVQRDYDYDVPHVYGRLGGYVQDTTDGLQNWIAVDQPGYDLLVGDSLDATTNFRGSIRGY